MPIFTVILSFLPRLWPVVVGIFSAVIAVLGRLWPVVVGIFGAFYFAAQGQFAHAVAVLTGGIVSSQVLHQTRAKS